jgi:hypothetical protein
MNPQAEQLKRRLHQKINSIEDVEYLTTLDAIIAWETAPEPQSGLFASIRSRLAEMLARRRKPRTSFYAQTALR